MVTPTLTLASGRGAPGPPWKPFNTVHGSGTQPFLLSPGQDDNTYPDIDQWWDSCSTTQEATQCW
uniref:Uncharacterized protein n=1 Tax=Romanomermis culicivorax TaxID=13658 RepID=A0A915J2N7_ROMCU